MAPPECAPSSPQRCDVAAEEVEDFQDADSQDPEEEAQTAGAAEAAESQKKKPKASYDEAKTADDTVFAESTKVDAAASPPPSPQRSNLDEHDSDCSDHEVDCEDCGGLFLPQYLLGAQILVPARDESGAEVPGEFELDNETLLPVGRAMGLPDYNGWHLRLSPRISDRHPTKFARWGRMFQGRIKDGWLQVAAVTW